MQGKLYYDVKFYHNGAWHRCRFGQWLNPHDTKKEKSVKIAYIKRLYNIPDGATINVSCFESVYTDGI